MRFALFVVAAAGCATTAAPRDPGELVRAEHAMDEATVRGDVAGFANMLADDYQEIRASGRVVDKAWLVSIFAKHEVTVLRYDRDDLQVRFFGDAALVTGHFLRREAGPGLPAPIEQEGRFADLFARRAGRWRLVFEQDTVTSTAPGGRAP